MLATVFFGVGQGSEILKILYARQILVEIDLLRDVDDESLGFERMLNHVHAVDRRGPEVGGMKLRNRLMVVVLPAPLAPSKQKLSPGVMVRHNESSTVVLP